MSCCVEVTDGVPSGGAAAAAEDLRRLLPAGPGSVQPLNLGIPNTTAGAASYIAPAGVATLRDSLQYQQWVSPGPGAANPAGGRTAAQIWTRSPAPANGGFRLRWVWTMQTFVLGHRAFFGLRAATAAIGGATQISTLTDIVGMGYNDNQTQWQLAQNDAAGAATMTPLGAGFNVNLTDVLALEISAVVGGATIEVSCENLTTAAAPTLFSLAAEIPAAALLLGSYMHVSTGLDATTVATFRMAEVNAYTPAL